MTITTEVKPAATNRQRAQPRSRCLWFYLSRDITSSTISKTTLNSNSTSSARLAYSHILSLAFKLRKEEIQWSL